MQELDPGGNSVQEIMGPLCYLLGLWLAACPGLPLAVLVIKTRKGIYLSQCAIFALGTTDLV